MDDPQNPVPVRTFSLAADPGTFLLAAELGGIGWRIDQVSLAVAGNSLVSLILLNSDQPTYTIPVGGGIGTIQTSPVHWRRYHSQRTEIVYGIVFWQTGTET